MGPGLEAVTEGVGPGWTWIRAADPLFSLTCPTRRTNVGHNIEQNSGEEKLEAAVSVLTNGVHAHTETFTRET